MAGDVWDISQPLDVAHSRSGEDRSGTPGALLESLRSSGVLILLEEVADGAVLVEYPLGEDWRARTGYSRFVRLREASEGGATHALVR
jgi:hypothetical protein